jgi:hypothetical protein
VLPLLQEVSVKTIESVYAQSADGHIAQGEVGEENIQRGAAQKSVHGQCGVSAHHRGEIHTCG